MRARRARRRQWPPVPRGIGGRRCAACASGNMLPDEGTCAHHIRGLTHPGHYMIAATALYKRRGRLTATVRSDWVERLFVLTDSAIMWFDLGGGLVPRSEPIGTQQGRVDARHFVSTTVTEVRPNCTPAAFPSHPCACARQRSGPASDNHEDLERLGMCSGPIALTLRRVHGTPHAPRVACRRSQVPAGDPDCDRRAVDRDWRHGQRGERATARSSSF